MESLTKLVLGEGCTHVWISSAVMLHQTFTASVDTPRLGSIQYQPARIFDHGDQNEGIFKKQYSNHSEVMGILSECLYKFEQVILCSQ